MRGRPLLLWEQERHAHSGSAGVVAMACIYMEMCGTRETLAVKARDLQLELREEQAGPFRVAERPVVAMNPGNAGGAKGP